jgi:putative endonuclease
MSALRARVRRTVVPVSASPSPRRLGGDRRPSTRAAGAALERRAAWHYRLRGFRILARNVWTGGNELDLVVRRGRRLVFVEVKGKSGDRYGAPEDMVGPQKRRRIRRAAEAWLAAHPDEAELDVSFEVVTVTGTRLRRIPDAF